MLTLPALGALIRDANAHYFCADFDGPNPLAALAAEYGAGSCTIDTADSHSAPASLSCQATAVANGASSARLLHPLPTTTSPSCFTSKPEKRRLTPPRGHHRSGSV